MTKGDLFLSMLCLSALNTMSGLLPSSPLRLFSLRRASGVGVGGGVGGDPANKGSPH